VFSYTLQHVLYQRFDFLGLGKLHDFLPDLVTFILAGTDRILTDVLELLDSPVTVFLRFGDLFPPCFPYLTIYHIH